MRPILPPRFERDCCWCWCCCCWCCIGVGVNVNGFGGVDGMPLEWIGLTPATCADTARGRPIMFGMPRCDCGGVRYAAPAPPPAAPQEPPIRPPEGGRIIPPTPPNMVAAAAAAAAAAAVFELLLLFVFEFCFCSFIGVVGCEFTPPLFEAILPLFVPPTNGVMMPPPPPPPILMLMPPTPPIIMPPFGVWVGERVFVPLTPLVTDAAAAAEFTWRRPHAAQIHVLLQAGQSQLSTSSIFIVSAFRL